MGFIPRHWPTTRVGATRAGDLILHRIVSETKRSMDALTSDDTLIPSAQCQDAFCRFLLARTGIIIQDHQHDNLRVAVSSACKRFGYASAFEYLTRLGSKAQTHRVNWNS